MQVLTMAPLSPSPQVSFRLTGAMKLRIFEEFPDVHALFLQKVPHELPEATFWSRYFRSRSAQKQQLAGRAAVGGGSGGSGAGAGGGGGAGEGGSAADALFSSTSRRSAIAPDARRQYPDTSAIAGEDLPSLLPSRGGYGLAEPGLATIGASGGELHRERPAERSERERREREYNHHGRTVLWGTGAAPAAMTGVSAATMWEARTAEARTAWTRLDDLDEVRSPSLAPLPPGLRAAGPRLAAAADAAATAAAVAAGAPPAPDPASPESSLSTFPLRAGPTANRRSRRRPTAQRRSRRRPTAQRTFLSEVRIGIPWEAAAWAAAAAA